VQNKYLKATTEAKLQIQDKIELERQLLNKMKLEVIRRTPQTNTTKKEF